MLRSAAAAAYEDYIAITSDGESDVDLQEALEASLRLGSHHISIIVCHYLFMKTLLIE